MSDDKILERVIACIAKTTRYPLQVLTSKADLENDLGIDSVKRVEIVVALESEFSLQLVSQERDPSIRTIQHLADWITDHLRESPQVDLIGQTTDTPASTQLDTSLRSELADHGQALKHRKDPPHERHQAAFTARKEQSSEQEFADKKLELESRPAIQSSASQPLLGKVALITGSGRGVGRAIARLLASQGATVIVNSFHSPEQGQKTADEIVNDGYRAVHFWGSVANQSQVEQIFAQIEQQFARLDILVCNASDGRIGQFTEVSIDDWDRAFHTNVTGHYQCAMLASNLMRRQGGGAIVTMSSIASRKYVQGLGGQGVIKAAVESLTRYLACELSPYNIRVNCVSGGPVYGDVMSMYPDSRATLNYWETLVLDSELCSPIELANTVAYLVGDQARGVNGATWDVDHGLFTRSHSRPLPQASYAAKSSTLNSAH